MKVTKEQLPESQVALQIEVDPERVEKAKDSAFRRLAAKAKVPGFRPGKAPRAVLERHLGPHTILHEAIDRLMPEVYREALEQEDIDPIDRAEYELLTEEPLVAKFTVPVRPEVELGDYASLRVPREPVQVDAERVQEALEGLRHRYATLEPVERPVAWNDVLTADVEGRAGDTVFVKEEDAQFQLAEGRTLSLPGLAEAIVARAKGDEFEVELSFPDDTQDEGLRGRQAHYRLRIKEVKQEVLPELNDDFAREVGEGFQSLEDLRTRIETDLREALEREAEQAYHDQIVDALVDGATLSFPPVLVEREAERLLHDQLQAFQQAAGRPGGDEREALERYLGQLGKSEEDVRSELRPIATTRVQRSLVLSELTRAEDIDVSEAEVEAEIDRLASSAGAQAEEFRRVFSTDNAKESLRRSLLTKKTLDRLAAIASGEAAEPMGAQAGASQST